MGCFCRNLIPMPIPMPALAAARGGGGVATAGTIPVPALLGAVGTWLSLRWLPAEPWRPDPAWLEIPWPDLPVPPASLGVLLALAGAAIRCEAVLGIDLFAPGAAIRLARVVATLNARMEALAPLVADGQPWAALLDFEAQVTMVEKAVAQGLFQLGAPGPPPLPLSPPWRQVLVQVKALAPLVALGQLLKLDWAAPNVIDLLSARVRLLARIALPPLADLGLVLHLVTQLDAVLRLKASFGADPRPAGFARVQAAVTLRAERVLALLPPGVRLEAGALVGMPALPPNPGLVLNPATIRLARLLTPDLLMRLNWQVPPFERLPLLTVGQPALALIDVLAQLGPNPVRAAPCGPDCDAARLTRGLAVP